MPGIDNVAATPSDAVNRPHSVEVIARADIMLLAQAYTGDENWGWADEGSYHAACFARTEEPSPV